MLSFNDHILYEFEAPSMERIIRDEESPPLILNQKSVERVFNIPSQHAMHALSIGNLIDVLPKIIGRSSQISTFTHLDTVGNPFFDYADRSIEDDNPTEAFVLLKGRVSGKFNMDIFSGMVKGGRRYIMLNDDTIEDADLDPEHESALSKMADEMRKFIEAKLNSFGAEYEEGEISNTQKQELIKDYIDYSEKLMSKYKQALMYFMVLQNDKTAYGYNELILDKVKPLSIYIKPKFSTQDVQDRIRSVKLFSRIPIKLNVKEADIVKITKRMR